LGLWCLPILL